MTHSTDDGRGPEVGSLAEETARLLEALEGWTRLGHRDDDASAEHEAHAHETDAHEAHASSPECRLCPLCQGARLMRSVTPEVRDHLASAVGSLLQAAAAMVAAHTSDSEGAEPRVQHIDLDSDLDSDDGDLDGDPPRGDGEQGVS